MGKSPLITERKFSYSGTFDLKKTYTFIKNYLEENKHYDVTEKEADIKHKGDDVEVLSKLEAELEYNDYYRIVLTFELNLKGKELTITDKNQITHKLVQGDAKITINSYLEKDFMHKRPKGALSEFLNKLYEKYIDKDEYGKIAGKVAGEIGDLLAKFKQQIGAEIK